MTHARISDVHFHGNDLKHVAADIIGVITRAAYAPSGIGDCGARTFMGEAGDMGGELTLNCQSVYD